jgi:hypothetical protein
MCSALRSLCGLAPFLRPPPEPGTDRAARGQGERERPADGGRLRGPGGPLFSGPDVRRLGLRPAPGTGREIGLFRARHCRRCSSPQAGGSSPCSASKGCLRVAVVPGMEMPRFAGRMPAGCVACAPPREQGTQGKMPQDKAERENALLSRPTPSVCGSGRPIRFRWGEARVARNPGVDY